MSNILDIFFTFSLFIIVIFLFLLIVRAIRNKYIYHKLCCKGFTYEKYIANFYKKAGYKVFENGLKKKHLDEGIDIICSDKNEILLIQCKNHKQKLNPQIAKKFLNDCFAYEQKNRLYKTRRILISSSKISNAMKVFMLDKHHLFEFKYMPFNQQIVKYNLIALLKLFLFKRKKVKKGKKFTKISKLC